MWKETAMPAVLVMRADDEAEAISLGGRGGELPFAR